MDDKIKRMIQLLHEADSLYLYIGEIISADNNITPQEHDKNKRLLTELNENLKEIKQDNTASIIPEEQLEEYIELTGKSLSIFDNNNEDIRDS